MFYFLFVGYLIVFTWLVTKVPAIKKTGIAPKWLMALFVLKVAVGCFYGWITKYYYGDVNDTWIYFNEGCVETDLILHKPSVFLTNIFYNEYKDGIFSFFHSAQSFWHSLKTNLFIKFIAILNLFSFKNYWVNVVFFNFIFYTGLAYFYRLLKTAFQATNTSSIILTFVMPSFLLFSSGINKEAIVFFCLSYMLFFFNNHFTGNKEQKQKFIYCFLAGALLFVIRDYVMLAFFPAVLCWYLTTRSNWHPYFIFLSGYTVLIGLFFGLSVVSSNLDFPDFIIKKQEEFRQLASISVVPIEPLEHTAVSFANATPRALYNVLLKPNLSDSSDYRYILFALELLGYYVLVLMGFIFRQRKETNALHLVFIFFSMTMFLVIGLIVPNVGAIVRYRSIYLPFILAPVIASFDWKRIFQKSNVSKHVL